MVNEDFCVSYMGAYKEGEYFYAVDIAKGILVKYRTCNMSYEVIDYNIFSNGIRWRHVRRIMKKGNSFYIVFLENRQVAEYALESHSLIQYEDLQSDYINMVTSNACMVNNEIWLLPAIAGEGIYIFDLDLKQFTGKVDIANSTTADKKLWARVINGMVWIGIKGTAFIISIDPATRELNEYYLPEKFCIESVGFGNGLFAISDKNSNE